MLDRRVAIALIALAIATGPVEAQSLGDVARQEEARRAAGSKSVKTLSNANLKPGEVSSPTAPAALASAGQPASPGTPASSDAPASCYMSIRLGRCVSADEMVANSAGKQTRGDAALEQKWRKDAESIRSQIDTTQRSIATLQSVVADEGQTASGKKAAAQMIVSAQRALADLERQWVKLERSAGNQRIPRAWIEPFPRLSTPQQ